MRDSWNFSEYCKQHGEDAARKELVKQLRAAADQIERGGFPDVYDADFPTETDPGKVVGYQVAVILSYPWGG